LKIKIAPTAKSCIRQALGQLLEYGLYPDHQRAEKLVVVGDGKATPEDLAYLGYLRKKFGLPIYYQRADHPALRGAALSMLSQTEAIGA
jgi:hypothetical protein